MYVRLVTKKREALWIEVEGPTPFCRRDIAMERFRLWEHRRAARQEVNERR
jgi:hypothetical protein